MEDKEMTYHSKTVQDNSEVQEFTRNKNHVRIKKCCASCQFHEPYDSNGPHRLCTYGRKKVVLKDELCDHWEISEQIDGIKLNI